MRYGLTAFDLDQTFLDRRQKLHPFGNILQACVCRQTLNRLQDKLLVAHTLNLP